MSDDIEKEIKGEVPSEKKEGGFEVMTPEEVEKTESGWQETQQKLKKEGHEKDIQFFEENKEKISPPLEPGVLDRAKEGLGEKWGIEEERKEEKYSPETRMAEVEHKIEKIKAWAEQSGLKENEDFLVIKSIGDLEEDKENIAPHERYMFFMAVHEKHYKEFRDYILGQYKKERKEENPESDVKIDYSWGGRFFVYNDGLSGLDTAPASHIENIEDIEKTVVHTHHKEFKESFRKKTGFEFPSAETLNPILKDISGEGLVSYEKAMDKLEEMEKLGTLPDEGYGLKNGLKYATMILEDAKRGKEVIDLPETIHGEMSYKTRHYNDLTYNADYLVDLDRVSKITNVRFSDKARIDKIFERWGFNRKKMEDVCRDFAEHLMDRRLKESK